MRPLFVIYSTLVLPSTTITGHRTRKKAVAFFVAQLCIPVAPSCLEIANVNLIDQMDRTQMIFMKTFMKGKKESACQGKKGKRRKKWKEEKKIRKESHVKERIMHSLTAGSLKEIQEIRENKKKKGDGGMVGWALARSLFTREAMSYACSSAAHGSSTTSCHCLKIGILMNIGLH